MKRIILSSLIIVFVSAMVIGGTTAFFNDTETSSGNVFTTGGIDLKVDSTAHYNGTICKNDKWVCDEWADHAVLTEVEQGQRENGTAVDTARSNPNAALGEPQSNGSFSDTNTDPSRFFSLGFGGHVTYRFDNLIMNGPGDDIMIYEITGGGTYPDESARIDVSQDGATWSTAGEVTRDGAVDLGALPWVKYVRVTDISIIGDFSGIPTADGFDVDGIKALHCSIEYEEIIGEDCGGSWELTNLGPEQTFFNFSDLKPGDYGENTISLHVDDNNAYGCAYISIDDDENGLTDPEIKAGDNSPVLGELSSDINFFAWDDTNGDNIWEDGESPLFADPFFGPASDVFPNGVFPLGALDTENTAYIGLQWCFGNMEIDLPNNDIICHPDGQDMDNQAQTDKLKADILFYVEQARHNDDFVCPALTTIQASSSGSNARVLP